MRRVLALGAVFGASLAISPATAVAQLTPVPAANTKAAGVIRPNVLSVELEEVAGATGSMLLENPESPAKYYGYNDDRPNLVPLPGARTPRPTKRSPTRTPISYSGAKRVPTLTMTTAHTCRVCRSGRSSADGARRLPSGRCGRGHGGVRSTGGDPRRAPDAAHGRRLHRRGDGEPVISSRRSTSSSPTRGDFRSGTWWRRRFPRAGGHGVPPGVRPFCPSRRDRSLNQEAPATVSFAGGVSARPRRARTS